MRFDAIRCALGQSLLLLPDDRPDTRRAVMRGAVWMNRAGCDGIGQLLSIQQRRKLLAPFTGGQRWWVAIGLALYGIARRNIFLLPIAGVALVMLTYSLISSFVW